MAEDRIKRKELWSGLRNIKKKKIWIDAAQKLGLSTTCPSGGSSHIALRLPGFDRADIKGHIANVYDPIRKDVSEIIFKKLLDQGYEEDDIWKALGML